MKSKAAYTNKWLERNKKFWHEEQKGDISIIIVDKKDAPKIVLERVIEINESRGWFDDEDDWENEDWSDYENYYSDFE